MARPGAEVREAELLERAPQAHLRQIDTEALSENTLQVDAAPAYDPILLRVGAGLDKLLQCLFLLVESFDGRPVGLMSIRPSGPYWLKRCAQSRSVCRSIPPIRAASVRFIPSRTAASASNRRACAASFTFAASRRSSSAPKSSRRPTAAPIADLPNQSSRSEMDHAGASFQNRVRPSEGWYHIPFPSCRFRNCTGNAG